MGHPRLSNRKTSVEYLYGDRTRGTISETENDYEDGKFHYRVQYIEILDTTDPQEYADVLNALRQSQMIIDSILKRGKRGRK